MKLNLQLFASTYSTQKTEEKTHSSTQGGSTSTTKGGSTSTTVTDNAAGKVDKLTEQKFNEYKQGYKPSQTVANAQKYLQDILNKKPGAFQSDYKAQLNSLYDQVTGREKFSYDMNTDLLYQQYKDMYTKAGQKAMQDTLGQASALTGGYDNSYAQMAAQQTYQDYLGSLNDKVPELYQMAYDRYQQEGDDLHQKFSMASDMYGKDYTQYRDNMADWQSDRNYAQGVYQDERNFDYSDFENMLNFYQQEYWNQRHAVSKSETNESHWSETNENNWSNTTETSSSTSTSNSHSSSGGSGGSGYGTDSDAASETLVIPDDYSESKAYSTALAHVKDNNMDVDLYTYNEFITSSAMRQWYSRDKKGYIDYLNFTLAKGV